MEKKKIWMNELHLKSMFHISIVVIGEYNYRMENDSSLFDHKFDEIFLINDLIERTMELVDLIKIHEKI